MFTSQTSLHLQGHGMNSLSEAYILPTDVTEHERLSVQHEMWRLLLGGLCPASLQLSSLLDPTQTLVLDVGCGAGHWSLEFSQEYPMIRVVGFDLAKSASLKIFPSNYEFVQGDIMKDMARFYGKASLINCRAVLGHLKNTSMALDVLHRCLKPGGIILLGEGDTRAYARDKESLAPRAGDSDQTNVRSWVSRFLYETEELNWKGVDQCGRNLSRWLRNHGGFDDIHAQDFFSPFGWSGDGVEHGHKLSMINRVNLTALAQSYKPSFLVRNHASESVVNKWCEGIQAEVNDPSVKRYLIFHVAWTRRKGEDAENKIT